MPDWISKFNRANLNLSRAIEESGKRKIGYGMVNNNKNFHRSIIVRVKRTKKKIGSIGVLKVTCNRSALPTTGGAGFTIP